MKVRIYPRAKNAMQSGRAKAGAWLLQYQRSGGRSPEPLMGWTSAGDTANQVTLHFETQDEAITYAIEKGWQYSVQDMHQKRIKPLNYGDNFRYHDPTEDGMGSGK